MTLTELDKAFNEALTDGDRSAVEFYDRQICLKMQAMDESGEMDHYDRSWGNSVRALSSESERRSLYRNSDIILVWKIKTAKKYMT